MSAEARILIAGKMQPVPVCCEAFATATCRGTDAEGYGALISRWSLADTRAEGVWRFASAEAGLGLFSRCPWCGAAVNKPVADETPLVTAVSRCGYWSPHGLGPCVMVEPHTHAPGTGHVVRGRWAEEEGA